MPLTVRVGALAMMCIGYASVAAGQPAPYQGARLRLWLVAESQITDGFYVGADRDSLALRPVRRGGEARFAWAGVTRIEQRTGVKRHALLGGLAGAGLGGFAGALLGQSVTFGDVNIGRTAGGIAGAVIGLGFGTLIGHLTRTEQWVRLEAWRVGPTEPLQGVLLFELKW